MAFPASDARDRQGSVQELIHELDKMPSQITYIVSRILLLLGLSCPRSVQNEVENASILPIWPLWGGGVMHPAQQLSRRGGFRYPIAYEKRLKTPCSEPYTSRSEHISCNALPSILLSTVYDTRYLGLDRPPFAHPPFPLRAQPSCGVVRESVQRCFHYADFVIPTTGPLTGHLEQIRASTNAGLAKGV